MLAFAGPFVSLTLKVLRSVPTMCIFFSLIFLDSARDFTEKERLLVSYEKKGLLWGKSVKALSLLEENVKVFGEKND